MYKLRTIIVDDEPLPLELLSDYVSKIPSLELAACFSSPVEAFSFIQKEKIDLILLDIEMPELTGLEFVKLIANKAKIIFTTAYPQFAIDGYDLNAVDYLLKPISFVRFLKAVQKVQAETLKLLSNVPDKQKEGGADYFFVKTDYKMVKVEFESILFIEGKKEYVSIQTKEARIVTLQNLKKMEELLPTDRFARVHKSFIIAIDKIEVIEKSKLILQNHEIPIGDTYRQSFFKKLKNRTLEE